MTKMLEGLIQEAERLRCSVFHKTLRKILKDKIKVLKEYLPPKVFGSIMHCVAKESIDKARKSGT